MLCSRIAVINIIFLSIAAPAKESINSQSQITPLHNIPCAEKVISVLSNWHSQNEWMGAPSESNNVSFRSPTDKIGTWVQIQKISSDEVRLSRITEHSQINLSWTRSHCEQKMNFNLNPSHPKAQRSFTDADIENLIHRKKPGIILLWSPHMPLSELAFSTARKAALATGRDLTLVLDSNADDKAASRTAQRYSLSKEALLKNNSIELSFRGMQLHFPAVVAYSNGKLATHMMPGMAEASLYEKYIREFSPQ